MLIRKLGLMARLRKEADEHDSEASGGEELIDDDQDVDPENPDGDAEEGGDSGEETEELAVTFEGVEPEEEEEKDESLVTQLRKIAREKTKRLKELERELGLVKNGGKLDELGPEPTIENPTGNPADEYDTEKFKQAYSAWIKKKAEHEKRAEAQKNQERQAQEQWNSRLAEYGKQKSSIRVADYDEAESEVTNILSEAQQSVLVKAAKNSALMVYGLGKNRKLLEELSKKTDLVEFTWAAAQLEMKMQSNKKPSVPPPEKTVSGGRGAPAGGRNLDSLKEKAGKSGDWTEYLAAKRKAKA
jgi:hypothetical protein